MKTWKIAPQDDLLARYIDCYWLLEKTTADMALSHDRPLLNPDPAGHLILASPSLPFSYQSELISTQGQGSHLILPHCHSLKMDHSSPLLILGIKFRVGSFYALNWPSAKPELDKVITANEPEASEFKAPTIGLQSLLSLPVEHLNSLLSLATPQQLCIELDKLIRPLFPSFNGALNEKLNEDKHSRLVDRALALSPSVTIANLGVELGCSQRTIERAFLRVTGLTLKQFYSMQRLEAMLNYLHLMAKETICWADIALKFGFSDQSHMIRYLKASIGQTPSRYAQQGQLTIDIYGNFE